MTARTELESESLLSHCHRRRLTGRLRAGLRLRLSSEAARLRPILPDRHPTPGVTCPVRASESGRSQLSSDGPAVWAQASLTRSQTEAPLGAP
eukprot:610841-Rhodomonas_salina.2